MCGHVSKVGLKNVRNGGEVTDSECNPQEDSGSKNDSGDIRGLCHKIEGVVELIKKRRLYFYREWTV